jgi:hypothetical protein
MSEIIPAQRATKKDQPRVKNTIRFFALLLIAVGVASVAHEPHAGAAPSEIQKSIEA